jgi:ribonuclease HII
MHKGIKSVLSQLIQKTTVNLENILLLIDGNYFKPFTIMNNDKTKIEVLKYNMIEGGDNKYTSIAAASILAKVERDEYIRELCKQHPFLDERYGLFKNKGYGTKIHIEGIKTYGYCEYHRKSFKLKQLGTTH